MGISRMVAGLASKGRKGPSRRCLERRSDGLRGNGSSGSVSMGFDDQRVEFSQSKRGVGGKRMDRLSGQQKIGEFVNGLLHCFFC